MSKLFQQGRGVRRIARFACLRFKFPHWEAGYAWHCAGYRPTRFVDNA